MDRRFFTWLMLTTAMCFLYLSMRPQLVPPKPEKPDNKANAAANDDPLLQENPIPGANPDDADNAAPENAGADPEASARPENPARAITLGSMNPEKGFNLLVTLTTRGAGVEQIELAAQKKPGRYKFRALEHDGGYLGYLGVTEAVGGMRVRTVPDGSPAALARCPDVAGGVQVGDVIQELNGASVDSHSALDKALATAKAGQTIDFYVTRDQSGSATRLKFTTELTEAPLDILRTNERITEQVEGNQNRPSLRTTLGSIDATRVPPGTSAIPALRPTLDMDWEVSRIDVAGGEGVEFRLPLDSFLEGSDKPSQLDLVKRYRLLPSSETNDGYLLDLETSIVNRSDKEVAISFRQEGLNGLTLEGWWYSVKISPYMFSGAGQRDVIFNSELESHQLVTTRQIQDHAKNNAKQPDKLIFSENEPAEARQLRYIGLDSQYFNASILAHPETPTALADLRQAATSAVADPLEIKKSRLQATNVSFWFDTNDQLIAPGKSFSQRYHIFVGPKDSTVLADHGLDRAIEYGWFPWIAKPLSAILHFFYMIVGNYGLAIVMLTVLVRGSMFPLGRKAALNAQRMQELQPELKKINDKYKDNMEKRAKAMQELYAKHNFKPLAGCLPMFIQLPIFIGLYRCLSVDISLRQEPLIPGLNWCSNLAGPDMLFNWNSWMPEFIAGRGTGWLGPYFNVLPIVTVALFLLQQKMLMPKATDDQTRMTQNMMQVMTIFMGVIFFKAPSGLCIYFITSSLWSLVERRLVKRLAPKNSTVEAAAESKADSAPPRPSRKDRRNSKPEEKKSGRLQELVQMLEKPAVKSSTQRGPQKSSNQKPARGGPQKSSKGGRKKKRR